MPAKKKVAKKKAPPRTTARKKKPRAASAEPEPSVDEGLEQRVADLEDLLVALDARVAAIEEGGKSQVDGQIKLGKRLKELETKNGIGELKALVAEGPDSLMSRVNDLEEMLLETDDERNRVNYKIVRYKDTLGQWRWTMSDRRNGETVGASHEGFADPRDCDHNLFINTAWNVDEVQT